MNTAVYEQMVSRKNLRWQTVLRVVVVEGLTLAGLLGLFSGELIVLVAALLLGVLAWYFLFPLFRVEYEYTLVGHDLQIDVIYGEKRRKKVISIDLSKNRIVPGTPEKTAKQEKPGRLYDATSGMGEGGIVEIRLSGEYRYEKVWIEPDETLSEMIRPWIRGLQI